MAHNRNSYTLSEPSNTSWSPDLMMSMKHTFEKQYARDKLTDILYTEQRRVRRAVPGPVEGYHHPNEINGVRLCRKGKGVTPSAVAQEQPAESALMPRRGKGAARLPTVEIVTRKQLRSPATVPEQQREQLWLSRGKRQDVPRPAEQKETLWSSKGRRLVPGMSNLEHSVESLIAWNPSATVGDEKPKQQQRKEQQQQPGQLPPPARPGKRVTPSATQSKVVFG